MGNKRFSSRVLCVVHLIDFIVNQRILQKTNLYKRIDHEQRTTAISEF